MTQRKRFFVVLDDDLIAYGDRMGFDTKEEAEEALAYEPDAGLVVIYGVRLEPEVKRVITIPEPSSD